MLTISKIRYSGEPRIKIEFDYNFSLKERIKGLPSAKFSYTLKAWHIEYSNKAYQSLLALDIDIKTKEHGIINLKNKKKDSNSNINPSEDTPKPISKKTQNTKESKGINKVINNISIEFHSPHFFIKTEYNQEIVSFIKNLKTSYWNNKNKVWITKACIQNLQDIQNKFNYWDKLNFQKLFDMISLLHNEKTIEIYRTPDNPKNIWIKLSGYKVDTDYMKHIDKNNYDERFKRWAIPYDESIIKRITEHYKSNGTKVINRLPQNDNVYKKQYVSYGEKQNLLLAKTEQKYKQIIKEYTDVLIAQRYSWNTVQLYVGAIVRYMNCCGDISNSTSTDINKYLAEKSAENISDSTINIIINAIKFYYTKVIFKPDFPIEKIKRPRKARRFPTILSKKEVERILKSLKNLKHITILYTIYSSGMRLGEILNLKVNDINFDRNQIFIRAGKGKKDRIVMLSSALKQILILYTDKYKPIYWLFESRDKNKQYSDSSIRNIVKSATRKARITKRVTPHTLRHCFATHLMDGGTQINYIQELLGHKDIKTTLLYTHLTTKNTTSIQSPLDNLDLGIDDMKNT